MSEYIPTHEERIAAVRRPPTDEEAVILRQAADIIERMYPMSGEYYGGLPWRFAHQVMAMVADLREEAAQRAVDPEHVSRQDPT